jgi:hypothetical protein
MHAYACVIRMRGRRAQAQSMQQKIAETLRFASRNRKLLRKLQSFLDVHNKTTAIWVHHALRTVHLHFFNNLYSSHLRLLVANHFECPVCLEDFCTLGDEIVITHCGHALCGKCVCSLHDTQEFWVGIRGILASHKGPVPRCVMCRSDDAFSEVVIMNEQSTVIKLWSECKKTCCCGLGNDQSVL